MDSISEIAQRLANISKQRESLASSLRELDKSKTISLKFKISENKLQKIKICGVDGGFLKKELHGAGIIMRRAVGVCFEYKNGKLENTGYFPGKMPLPDAVVTGPELSEIDFNLLAGLKREEIELQACLQSIEKFSPDILIRDGSIVLYPSNLPAENSEAHKTYKEDVGLYKKLYNTCEEKNILLCGVVEDSRGKRYCKLLHDEIIPNIPTAFAAKLLADRNILLNTTDTLFLYYLLDVGERTAHMDYAQSSELPILKDLEEYGKKIFAVYIKAVEFDRPLRIDFLSAPEKSEETAQKISEIIYAISKQNRTYSYPNVLIEADGRAKLSEVEIEHFMAELKQKLGHNPAMFELRREVRPF